MDQTPFTRFVDPAVLIRIARGLDADAPVHVNPAYAESLRRVAEYVWEEGYVAKEDYDREYAIKGLNAQGSGNPYE